MPSNRRNPPSRTEIPESEQKPGVEENTQKGCHTALLNVVPHGGRGTADRAHHARRHTQVVSDGHHHEMDAQGEESFHDKVAVENIARVVLDQGQRHRLP